MVRRFCGSEDWSILTILLGTDPTQDTDDEGFSSSPVRRLKFYIWVPKSKCLGTGCSVTSCVTVPSSSTGILCSHRLTLSNAEPSLQGKVAQQGAASTLDRQRSGLSDPKGQPWQSANLCELSHPVVTLANRLTIQLHQPQEIAIHLLSDLTLWGGRISKQSQPILRRLFRKLSPLQKKTPHLAVLFLAGEVRFRGRSLFHVILVLQIPILDVAWGEGGGKKL